jgi:hypothetical protein
MISAVELFDLTEMASSTLVVGTPNPLPTDDSNLARRSCVRRPSVCSTSPRCSRHGDLLELRDGSLRTRVGHAAVAMLRGGMLPDLGLLLPPMPQAGHAKGLPHDGPSELLGHRNSGLSGEHVIVADCLQMGLD